MTHPEFRHVDPQGPDALALLHEAWLDARALSPDLAFDPTRPPTNAPLAERGVHGLAVVGGVPLASGALRPRSDDTAEVRRVDVHRDHRRRGLGHAVLDHLVAEAKRLRYSRLVLEAGMRRVPAIRLHGAAGFDRIAPFDEDADDPTSVCFGLRLGS